MAAVKPLKPVAPIERHENGKYLTFTLGSETFAFDILCIREILEYQVPTNVPMMPSFVRGIINLRGAVIPIVDLPARFGRPSSPISKKTCIVITESRTGDEAHVFGAVVDAVSEVIEIPSTAIEPPPTFGIPLRIDFVRGLGKVNERFVMILNADAALSLDEMSALADAARAS